MGLRTVAILYCDPRGPYPKMEGVECWDEQRDARLYAGPHPVVAHPPCERWGRYWHGGPSARVRRVKGDDGGCFAAALAAVRAYGGVLEHPEASHAFAAYGLAKPPKRGGWEPAGDGVGYVCCVEQGHYGHRARKATWLYAVVAYRCLPALTWGPSASRVRLDLGFHNAEERKAFRSNRTLSPALMARKKLWLDSVERATGKKEFKRLGALERRATPQAFADLLVAIARSG